MPASSPLVAIVVLNWNGAADTIACLESLCLLKYGNFAIVVVDNASTDDSVSRLVRWGSDRRQDFARMSAEECELVSSKSSNRRVLIQNYSNLGFAGGNNLGIRYSLNIGAEYIWILNNDTIVSPDSLSPLVEAMSISQNVGITGSCVLYWDRPEVVQTAGMRLGWHNLRISHISQNLKLTDWPVSKQGDVDCLPACSILVNSRMVQNIGQIDESYFMYHEDVDWEISAKRAGWRILYVPSSRIWHKCGGSTKKMTFVGAYYQSRNKLRLIRKNESDLFLLLVFPLFFALVRNVIAAIARGEFRNAKYMIIGATDFFLGKKGMRAFGSQHQ